jgi:RNA polymerase sigma-70 factor (ECF subfamily)
MRRDSLDSDTLLIERMREGDARAFESIFSKYYEPLCRQIVGYLGDRDAAEDVVQGVLARLWAGRATFAPPESLGSYLNASVRRGAVDQLRRDAVRRKAAPLLMLESGERREASEGSFDADILRHRFGRAVAALPPRTREAFILSRREGLSYDEIALRMKISVKTVGVHVGNSLKALREVIPD